MSEVKGHEIPATTTRVETIVVNSRFVTTAGHVDSVEAARAFIHVIRSEMADANHHVYAFRVGHGASVIDGMSDDGEPSGTSGPPTMAVLRGSGLGDIVVVTTRFFGGTLLGTGGLTRAYSEAARAVLAALPRIRKIQRANYALEVPYSLYELTLRLLSHYEVDITDQDFGADVTVYYSVAVDHAAPLEKEMTELSSGSVTPTFLD
ncbi:MAG: YigZ family protein [Chloroflexi bacterium]|nr:YigZ family protein [Chloroflexota bacterium]